jgi:hypothetical protein
LSETNHAAGIGGIGLGTVVLALAASYFLGIDPSVILGLASHAPSPATHSAPAHLHGAIPTHLIGAARKLHC